MPGYASTIEFAAKGFLGPRLAIRSAPDIDPSTASRLLPPMPHADLATTIDAAFEGRDAISRQTGGAVREAVEEALNLLDRHSAWRKRRERDWQVNQWLKKAVLLSFRLNDMQTIPGGPGGAHWWDKVPSKFSGWDENRFREAGFRAVPGAIVRHSAFIGKNAILMPSFVNLGAYVDEGAMVDTWAAVGSCAQIGKHVHLSGGAGIGGVLEPLQAGPVIIEDNCFIGARSEIVEGVVVGEGSVISMGVFIGQSTKIVDRTTGETISGRVPPYSVVISGSMQGAAADGTPGPGFTARSSSSVSMPRRVPNLHQRPVARVITMQSLPSCSPTSSAALYPPAEEGVLDVLEAFLVPLGFVCTRLRFEGDGSYPVDNLSPRASRRARPASLVRRAY